MQLYFTGFSYSKVNFAFLSTDKTTEDEMIKLYTNISAEKASDLDKFVVQYVLASIDTDEMKTFCTNSSHLPKVSTVHSRFNEICE